MIVNLIVSLFLLVSCVDSGDSDYQMRTASGALTRQWVSYGGEGDITVSTVDFSNPSNIQINGVKYIKKTVRPDIDREFEVTVHTGNCVLSGAGPIMLEDYYGYFDTKLVSGDVKACGVFVPTIVFKHYSDSDHDHDILKVGSSALK